MDDREQKAGKTNIPQRIVFVILTPEAECVVQAVLQAFLNFSRRWGLNIDQELNATGSPV